MSVDVALRSRHSVAVVDLAIFGGATRKLHRHDFASVSASKVMKNWRPCTHASPTTCVLGLNTLWLAANGHIFC